MAKKCWHQIELAIPRFCPEPEELSTKKISRPFASLLTDSTLCKAPQPSSIRGNMFAGHRPSPSLQSSDATPHLSKQLSNFECSRTNARSHDRNDRQASILRKHQQASSTFTSSIYAVSSPNSRIQKKPHRSRAPGHASHLKSRKIQKLKFG